jgi:hypothetical protein
MHKISYKKAFERKGRENVEHYSKFLYYLKQQDDNYRM